MSRSKGSRRRHQTAIPGGKTQPAMPPPSFGQPMMQIGLGYDPKGKMELKDIKSSKEGWSEYELDDGSIVRIKGVLLDVKRAVGQFNLEGDPIYIMQMTLVNQLKAADNLKKDYVETSKSDDKTKPE